MNYAREKLHAAVSGMATSHGSIQRRICDAYIYNLIHIRSEGLSPAIASGLEEITQVMRSRKAEGDEGDAWASCSRLSDDDASAVARQIVDLSDLATHG